MFQNVKLDKGVRFDDIPNLPFMWWSKTFFPPHSDSEWTACKEVKSPLIFLEGPDPQNTQEEQRYFLSASSNCSHLHVLFQTFQRSLPPFFRLSLIMIVLCSRFLPLSWCYLHYLYPPWFLSTYNILHSAFIILYCLEHTVLLCLFFPFFSTVLSNGSGESLMRSNSGWAGQPLDIETSIFSPFHALTPFLLGHQRF